MHAVAYVGLVLVAAGATTLGTLRTGRPEDRGDRAIFPDRLQIGPRAGADLDRDGIDDALEEQLAARYAPEIDYDAGETNFPTNVDSFLLHTSLSVFEAGCGHEQTPVRAGPLAQGDLRGHAVARSCGDPTTITSDGSRSRMKQFSYFLADVPLELRGGSAATSEWSTYYHAYPNDQGGITIQFWRFYAFNTGLRVGPFELGYHGGDWEAIHVVLDHALAPDTVRLLGHDSISAVAWSSIGLIPGTSHPVIFAERGSHTSHAARPAAWSNGTRQESWPGGLVHFADGRPDALGGALVNLGEKLAPRLPFLVYSGLWGSPGFNYQAIPQWLRDFIRNETGHEVTNFSSGYWGPAFNETSRVEATGFIAAWCAGHRTPGATMDGTRECYPSQELP